MKKLLLSTALVLMSISANASSTACDSVWAQDPPAGCKGKNASCVKRAVEDCQKKAKAAAPDTEKASKKVCDKPCSDACDEQAVKGSGGKPSEVLRLMNECMMKNAK